MFQDLINKRFTIRHFNDKKINIDTINKIIEAGRLSPSWVNSQPWKFICVENPDIKELLYIFSGNQIAIKTAYCVIVVVGDTNAWNHKNFKSTILSSENFDEALAEKIVNSKTLNPKNQDESTLKLRTYEQCAYCTSYMQLMATDLGLGSCIIGHMNTLDNELYNKVFEILNIDKNSYICSMLALGYYDQNKSKEKLHNRKDFNSIVTYK